jgi:transcriptional repressor NF-X1
LSCPLLPESMQYCPCGQTLIAKLLTVPRTSCLDPIPTCYNTCGRQLTCGNIQKGQFHRCESKCHAGNCPPCSGTTNVQCQCGQTMNDIPCKEFSPSEGNL